ncbi:MAG: DUF2142 domain-containing protein [Lachnospiraceae bacterium]
MEKHKLLIFRILFLILFAMAGVLFSGNMIYDYTQNNVTLEKDDISFLKGYELNNNQYCVISDDPQMVFDFPMSPVKLSNVCIIMDEGVSETLPVQVFYRNNMKDFSEMNSKQTCIPKGDDRLVLDFDGEKCTSLRVDIDGAFSLKEIELSGQIGKINGLKATGYCFCILVILFVLWKYVSQKAGICFFGMLEKIARGYMAIYRRIEIFFSKKNMKIQHVFVILAFIYGSFMLFLIPPNQVPDEFTHYFQIVQSSGFTEIDNQIENYMIGVGSFELQGRPLEKVNKTLLREHMHDQFDKSVVEYTSTSIHIVKHLPSAIMFFVGYFLNLPIGCCLSMAEIGSLIFYLIMGYLTLKYMPIKKELMFAILLLPMTVQQCTSVNYDSVLIPVSLFFTAYVFYCKYEKESVGFGDLFIFLSIAFVIMLIKPTNFPVFLQLLFIPFDKWKLVIGNRIDLVSLIKKWKWFVLAVCIAGVCFVMYVGRYNVYIQLVEACILRPDLTFVRIYHTLKELGGFYVKSLIADLGWLDTLMPGTFYVIVFVFLFVVGQWNGGSSGENTVKLRFREKILGVFVAFATMYMIFIAMFTWTMYLNDIDFGSSLQDMIGAIKEVYISLGVQGRYFTPVVFLLFLPFDGLIKMKKEVVNLIQCIYYPVCIGWSLFVVLQRYWM